MAFELHHLTPQNKTLLKRIAPDVFDYDINPGFLETYLAQPHHAMMVAVRDDIIVAQIRGIIHFQPDEPPQLYIDNLGVSPDAQRQGIASALFAALVNWGQSKGCQGYWVATECDNDEGNGFYQSLKLEPQQMYFYEGER